MCTFYEDLKSDDLRNADEVVSGSAAAPELQGKVEVDVNENTTQNTQQSIPSDDDISHVNLIAYVGQRADMSDDESIQLNNLLDHVGPEASEIAPSMPRIEIGTVETVSPQFLMLQKKRRRKKKLKAKAKAVASTSTSQASRKLQHEAVVVALNGLPKNAHQHSDCTWGVWCPGIRDFLPLEVQPDETLPGCPCADCLNGDPPRQMPDSQQSMTDSYVMKVHQDYLEGITQEVEQAYVAEMNAQVSGLDSIDEEPEAEAGAEAWKRARVALDVVHEAIH